MRFLNFYWNFWAKRGQNGPKMKFLKFYKKSMYGTFFISHEVTVAHFFTVNSGLEVLILISAYCCVQKLISIFKFFSLTYSESLNNRFG